MGWNTPVVIQGQPTYLERIMPSLLSIGAQFGLQKMGQSFQTEQAKAAGMRAQKAEEKKRQWEAMLKGAKYDSEKGTLVFEPIELTEDQKEYLSVVQMPGGPQIKKKPAPKEPKLTPGKDFHWRWDDRLGKMVQTKVPVGTTGNKLTGDVSLFHQLIGRKPKDASELKAKMMELRLPPQTTVSERDVLRRQKAIQSLTLMAQKDPNEVYSHGYKMNADRTLYIDPVDKAPVKLPHFTKVMGKRGGPKMAKAAGEFWDDTVEIQELLNNPEVVKNLQWAEKEGLWDRVKGSWSNKINLWLTKKGFSKTSKTTETIVRIQRLASIERLKYLGSAVTATELESILPWLPSAGDSFSTMATKTDVAAKEGEETFRRYLEMYQDICDMSPFYKAFGLKRFEDKTINMDTLKSKYGLE